jgi:hypothetical protein
MTGENFILCFGAQRAGTTWLSEQLRRHPGTSFPPRKELRFLDALYVHEFAEIQRERLKEFRKRLWHSLGETPSLSSPALSRELRWNARYALTAREDYTDDWYRGLFAECDPDKLTGDFSPDYSLLPDAGVEHLHRLVPRARLVFLLRNPVERTWSGATYPLRHLSGLTAEEQTEATRRIARTSLQRQFSDYRAILERFWKKFDRSSVCTVFHDDINLDPMRLLRSVCNHVGLDFHERYFDSVDRSVNRSPVVPRDEALIRDLHEDYIGTLEWLHSTFGDHASRWHAEAMRLLG